MTCPHTYGCSQLRDSVANGWVSGYSDPNVCPAHITPCFLPWTTVTRQQYSKIIVNTFGFGGTSISGPHYCDVPTTSPFYTYIEILWTKNLAGGYPGPVCSGGLSTYFQPTSNVTRGQIAKMVANAAGLSMTSQSGRQTFYDVNSSNAFYTYIESLVQANANAMYPPYPDLVQPACGSTSMPCYFPGANSVRLDAVVQTYMGAAIHYYGSQRNAQVFPHLGATDNNSDWYGGKYEAIYSYVSTPSNYPSVNNTINAPVGLTDYYDGHYIESGFQVTCDANNNCQRHPYGTWGDGDTDHGGWNISITLTAGQGYTYRTDPAGTNAWASAWCNSNSCTTLATTSDLGRQRMPMAFAGGESYPFTQHFGTFYLYDNQVRIFGTWGGWCYDSTQAPIDVLNPLSQAIGACSSSAWTVSYP